MSDFDIYSDDLDFGAQSPSESTPQSPDEFFMASSKDDISNENTTDLDIYSDVTLDIANPASETDPIHSDPHQDADEDHIGQNPDGIQSGDIESKNGDDRAVSGADGSGEPSLPIPMNNSVYIGGLNWWTTDQQLEEILTKFGKLRTIKFHEDTANGSSEGNVYIEFTSHEAANAAKEHLDGTDINGSKCSIRLTHHDSSHINFSQFVQSLKGIQYTGGNTPIDPSLQYNNNSNNNSSNNSNKMSFHRR
eukprot:TRINITY_DN13169_c0_g1_i1.p1 TRINITY_DN13169_c0_g1~~TRINITY_DN13169_c0_g1_i1.p1  ORF type:complete len:249 (-),score=59.12 TRINITY_DN13169_c0_g1_i1:10-756(-)